MTRHISDKKVRGRWVKAAADVLEFKNVNTRYVPPETETTETIETTRMQPHSQDSYSETTTDTETTPDEIQTEPKQPTETQNPHAASVVSDVSDVSLVSGAVEI